MPVKKAKTTKKTKNAWQLTTIPVHSWITFWVLVLATMALATVCFTDAFKNSKGEVDQESVEAFKAIQQSLEQQVADLQGKVGVEQKKEGRVLADLGSHIPECLAVLSTSTTDLITVSYLDTKNNVRMNLPYSFAWGNEDYALNPTDKHEAGTDEVFFGPGWISGDCKMLRDSRLMVDTQDKRPVNEVRSVITNPVEGTVSNLRERTINGMQVLSYNFTGGGSSQNNWIAFGRTNRYLLSSEGWLTDAEAVKIIQSLRVEN